MTPVPAANNYAERFRQNIARGVLATLDTIPDDESLLCEDVKARALRVLDHALKVDEAWTGTRDLLLVMAPKMEQAGHRGDWLLRLEDAVKHSRNLDDRTTAAELGMQIGNLYYRLSQFDKATRWLTFSLEGFEEQNNLSGQCIILNRLALVACREEKFQYAAKLALQALDNLKTTELEQANSHYVLGEVARARNMWQKAESHFRHSLKLWEERGSKREIARGLRNLGPALRKQEKYTEAINCYERALSLFAQIDDPVNQAKTQTNLGIIYSICDRLYDALKLFRAAEKVFSNAHDHLNLAKVYINMGINYRKLGEYKQSEETYLAGINIWHQLGNIRSLCNAMDGLGLTYLSLNRYNKAICEFNKALDKLVIIKDEPYYHKLREMLLMHIKQARLEQKKSEHYSFVLDHSTE
ncbi:MAG: tetratricopeptide repeat protein [Chloroflexota bacterium]